MLTDRELVRRLMNGDETAFDHLIRRHEAFVRCCLAGGNWRPRPDLEDLVQEVWVKLWRNNFNGLREWRGLVEGPDTVSLRPYLRTICKRILLDRPQPP